MSEATIEWKQWDGAAGVVRIARGKSDHHYAVTATPDGYRLVKQAAMPDTLDVRRLPTGRLACPCPAAKFNYQKCKHILALEQLPTMSDIAAKLRAFFPADKIGWKPQSVSKDKTKAMAVAYIDARDVMDRLDEVVGMANWRDEYVVLPGGNVQCTLAVRIDGEWITKVDVGGESDQKSDGDRTKAAYSDALKRAAVKFGIGRYLYDFPMQWLPFDGFKFTRQPTLPAWADPARQGKPADAKAADTQVAPASTRHTGDTDTPTFEESVAVLADLRDSLEVAESAARINEIMSYPEVKSLRGKYREQAWELIQAAGKRLNLKYLKDAKKFIESVAA